MGMHSNSIILPRQALTVVHHLQQHGVLTRNEVAGLLDVSRSKATNITNGLIKQGIIEEEAVAESTGGRRPQLLALRREFAYVVGIQMGATGADICVANLRGEVLGVRRLDLTVRGNPNAVMDSAFQQVFALLEDLAISPEQVRAVGIGVPAPVDKDSQHIVSPAIMLGWENYSIVDYVQQHFPGAVIQVGNDASLMALGEYRMGAGRGHENFIFVKIGTGIGCGIISNGRVYLGSTGCSGHIGHVSIDRDGPVCYCGNVGCLEKMVAAPAMVARALQAVKEGKSPILAHIKSEKGVLALGDVGDAAGAGDKIANDIILQSGQAIGKILATLVSFFNPSQLIVGGRASNIAPQLLVSIHRTILEYSLPLSTRDFTIQRSEMGYEAGAHGAVALALDSLFTVG